MRVSRKSPSGRAGGSPRPRTLAVDVGGSNVKAVVLDAKGKPLQEATRLPTPPKVRPTQLLRVIEALGEQLGTYERVAVGFPGVVVRGRTLNAANLGPGWKGCPLQQRLEARLGVPVRVANDADVQGLAVIEGDGVELVLTLGTGIGSALFVDGILVPNLEMGHHPFRRNRSYEQELGLAALKRVGEEVWNERLRDAIDTLHRAFSFTMLYLGGGNARLIRGRTPRHVKVVSNRAGLLGGIALYRRQSVR